MYIAQKNIDRIQQYASRKIPLRDYGFTSHMKLRIMIAERLFQVYSTGRVPLTRHPRKVLPLVAEQIYASILALSNTDEEMATMVADCEIYAGKKRTNAEMVRDLEAYEVLRNMWGVDTTSHAKALCEEGAYQLIEMGLANGNERSLSAGIDRLSKLHNDFQEKAEDFSATADTEVDFIADAKLVRADAENLSRDAIENLKRKYGAYIDEKHGGIETLIQNEEGVYEPVAGDAVPDDDKDYFELAEADELARRK